LILAASFQRTCTVQLHGSKWSSHKPDGEDKIVCSLGLPELRQYWRRLIKRITWFTAVVNIYLQIQLVFSFKVSYMIKLDKSNDNNGKDLVFSHSLSQRVVKIVQHRIHTYETHFSIASACNFIYYLQFYFCCLPTGWYDWCIWFYEAKDGE
jgi:hypothetical protein